MDNGDLKMFCSKCGKEIPDDSVVCYSCGAKVEIKEKQNTVTDPSSVVVNKKTNTEPQDNRQTTFEKECEQGISSNDQKHLPQKTERSWGWLVLVCFYVGYILKITNTYNLTSFSIKILGLVITIIFYFWLKKFLPNKGLFKMKFKPDSNTTSFVSGVLSFYLIGTLVLGTVGYLEGHQKNKELEEFMNNNKGRIEMIDAQGVEYVKIIGSKTTTESEVKDKILKIDEYKKILVKKNQVYIDLTNFFREINSKYKKDKSVDEQITELEKIFSDIQKTSMDSLDFYKQYLITGDKKYLILHQQGYEKMKSARDEVTKRSISIYNSL
ncbi:MAG: zinc ribbon domain-containing protein [Smithella sp.]